MDYKTFIERAHAVHGEKYTYEKFDELSVLKKVNITCPEHGDFKQVIYAHLRGQGCPRCVGSKRGYTTEDFIRDAKEKFGDKFDYSKVNYTGRRNKVCIMCKDLITEENPTGEFWQKPFIHLNSTDGLPFMGKRGREYPKITDEDKIEAKTDEFKKKMEKIFGNKYDYSEIIYTGCFQKVKVICKKHGVFEAMPVNLLKGHGCPYCSNSKPMTKEEFIEKARKVHGDKYDYSKVEIGKADDKLCIICHEKDGDGNEHGEFYQTISRHLRGSGCNICAGNSRLGKEEFVKRAKRIHGDKYDYSKVEYTNNQTPVCIICPKHGEFWQIPASHLRGSSCPICSESRMEAELLQFFKDNNINFERQKTFSNIKFKNVLPFDFYLPDYNAVIECQGLQHFEEGHFFNDKDRFVKDKIKHDKCKENNIKILYYTNIEDYERYYNDIYNNDNITSDKNLLLEKLKRLE